MHKSACQSDCVATARPSCPLLPPKQPRDRKPLEHASPSYFPTTDPSRIYSPPLPSLPKANRNLLSLFLHRRTNKPNSKRIFPSVVFLSRKCRVYRVVEISSIALVLQLSLSLYIYIYIYIYTRENERQARSINHTFVGITLVYEAAFARSKGSPGCLPFPPESIHHHRSPLCGVLIAGSPPVHASTLLPDT